MKRLIALIDLSFFFIAVFNLLLILIIPSNTDEFSWRINYIYTFTTVILLLVRSLLVLIREKFSTNAFRRISIDLFFILTGLFSIRFSLKLFQFYVLIREILIVFQKVTNEKLEKDYFNNLFKYPTLWIILSFFGAIILGSFALILPGMTNKGYYLNYIDALFTSTSAICVTGLTVTDTGTSFSVYGQLVILTLIQIGGLGIMTISSALALAIGQKFSLRSGALMQNVLSQGNLTSFTQLIKNIIIFTFTFEIMGALLLIYPLYNRLGNMFQAVYYAIFHSVSAFCNAGFALFPDSFVQFRTNPLLNLTICMLIVCGGLGFAVIDDSKKLFKRNTHFSHLKLHSKIVLTTTFFLLLAGTFLFFVSEYNYTMKSFHFFDKLLSSFFQSTTTRTAGFNTIDFSKISYASVLISIILMYIGASPGSTGGGIKTPTLAIIILSVVSIIKGKRDVTVFNRRFSDEIMMKVLALIALSLFFVMSIVFILLLIEPFSFEKILFESFSAFGTVGLSMGITSFLSNFGKLLIIILMFIGRVGPLTFIFLFAENVLPLKYAVPQENVDIG
ncbi:MAG: potassium transporter Trk [Candidatus Cloacimonetes bacterium]|nr:potassium transporter Trk [Candidatus Cloacimonadota bacterium]HPM01684.1 TrkH family potassium uptake protein [Candidatus Cloacimonadota bacterium]